MTGGAKQTFRQTFKVSKEILHWYPGHMNKGMVNMQSKLKNVDCVVEVHDARVALSGRNPNFVRNLLGVKPHILILNKVDLIDSSDIKRIEEKVKKDGVENVLFTNCLKYATCPGLKTLIPKAINLIKKSERYNRSEAIDLSMMIIGIPNVGKSSLINALRKKNLSRKNASLVGAVAGITKSVLTKIKVNVNPNMYLIDTPGILPPNISNSEIALKLALCSCYKDTAIGEFVMADFLLYWFNKMGHFCYVDELRLDEPKDEILSVLLKITQDYNFYKKVTDVTNNSIKTMPDFDKAAHLMVTMFRKGSFGLINLDSDLM